MKLLIQTNCVTIAQYTENGGISHILRQNSCRYSVQSMFAQFGQRSLTLRSADYRTSDLVLRTFVFSLIIMVFFRTLS